MLREERVRLLLRPTFGPLQKVIGLLRSLPWPTPLQRVTQHGLERLKARIPELAELLDGTPKKRAPRTQSKTSVSALPELLALLGARDYQTRTKAAQALANHRDEEAIEALVGVLRDRSVEVAVAAATALSVSGGGRARRALLAVLDNAEGYYHPLTRAAAVHGLGGLTRDDHMPLQRALRDQDAEVSIAAISALSSSYARESTIALLGVVENTEGFFLPITRLAAARGLERLPLSGITDLERVRAWEGDPLVAEVLDRLLARARSGATAES
jgi:hypothetical protein